MAKASKGCLMASWNRIRDVASTHFDMTPGLRTFGSRNEGDKVN